MNKLNYLIILSLFLRSYCLNYELKSVFSHNYGLFTQGLQYYKGYLYESGGNYGQSTIQIIHPDTGLYYFYFIIIFH